MNPSSSIVRPVAIAASTIPLIEVWMPGIRGRNRHSYSIELAGLQLDDRLVGDRVDVPEGEEVVEHLRLDDVARLGHPDPLGQAGLLDGRGQADEVALALGQRRVQGHEAVGGERLAAATSAASASVRSSAGPMTTMPASSS